MAKAQKLKSRGPSLSGKQPSVGVSSERLFHDVRELIEQARRQVAQTINLGLVWLYWQIGQRIRQDVVGGSRATYGEEILQTLSEELTAEYGKGFSREGKMELYLRWLEKHERHADEEPPIGLILCADKAEEHVRLLRLDAAGIRVARYLTQLPPREVLEKKLHEAIRLARQQLARRLEGQDQAKPSFPDKARQKKMGKARHPAKKSQ